MHVDRRRVAFLKTGRMMAGKSDKVKAGGREGERCTRGTSVCVKQRKRDSSSNPTLEEA